MDLELKLKRLQMAKDYFMQFPAERIHLDAIVTMEPADCNNRERQIEEITKWKESYGLDCLTRSCGTIACVHGVLLTMPEIRDEWHKNPAVTLEGVVQYHPQAQDLEQWLGLDHYSIDDQHAWQEHEARDLFAPRLRECDGEAADDKTISDQELAVRRFDRIILRTKARLERASC